MITCAICPSCAREHPEGARLCTVCGTPLTLAMCAACDAINAIGASRCHQCGADLARGDASVAEALADRLRTQEARASPDEFPTFVLDAVDGASAEDGFIDLAGERRYVGPDGAKHAFVDATPITFAERVAHALPEPESFADGDATPRGERRAPRVSARRVHVAFAVALVIAVGASAYFAFDLPAMRAVVAHVLARTDAFATLAAPAQPARPVERTDKAVPNASPSRVPDATPSTPEPDATPAASASESASPQAETPGRPAADASPNRATPPSGGQRSRVAEPAPAKARKPDAPRVAPARPQAPAATTRPVDRDALETQRLIERDLGRFLAK